MKPYLLTIIIFLTLPGLAHAQQDHLGIAVPARIAAKLLGSVKSIETDICRDVSDKHTRKRTEYDAAGNCLVILNWDSEGDLTSTTTNFYDKTGGFYHQQYMRFGEKGITNEWKVILSPDTRQIAKKNERTEAIIIRTYSPEKYQIHFKEMDKEKTQRLASHSKRREDHRKTEYTKSDPRNRPIYTCYYKWTDQGFIDKERIRYHQKKKELLHTYEYLATDDHGNWTQQLMIRYDVGGKEKSQESEKLTVRTIEYFDPSKEDDHETP